MTVLWCLAAWCSPARSEQVYKLSEIEVRADAEPETTGTQDATGFVSVIRVDELPSHATSVPEVLDQAAGVTVKQYGGLGSFSTVSVRGSSSEQVAIFLDGILLNTAISGVVNLADIPLDNVEKIEVYRGTSPARFGASGIGGVVNIVTKKTDGALAASLNYTRGSFDTHKANLYLSGGRGALDGSLYYNRTQSQGDFRYVDDRGTDYNHEDDQRTRRRNNDFHADEVLLKAGYRLADTWRLEASSDTFQKKQGIPGVGSYQSETAELETLRNLSQLRLHSDSFIRPDASFELLLAYSYQRQKFKDPHGEIGVGQQDSKDDTRSLSGRALFSMPMGAAHYLTLLSEANRETYCSRDRLANTRAGETVTTVSHLYGFSENLSISGNRGLRADEQVRTSYSAGLEDEITLLGERILITPSIKYGYYENDFNGLVPFASTPIAPDANTSERHVTRKIGLLVYLSEWFTLKGNAGRYYRVPSFYELFGDRGAVVGNTELESEKSTNWDIGWSLSLQDPVPGLQSLLLEYSYYHNRIKNLILFVQNSQRTAMAMNISAARITGQELYWKLRLGWPVLISGNYTRQNARDKSSIAYWQGNQLPGRPRHELFNRTELAHGRWRLFHELSYTDRTWLDRANVRKIRNRILQNAGVTCRLSAHVRITLEAKNVTDKRTADVIGYPLPGRSFFATLELKQ